MTDAPTVWEKLPDELRWAIAAAWRDGMPSEATALYGRWWQLETWLRSLAYVELRARDGLRWVDALPPSAADRETKDRRQPYMSTPDAQARLAYLDLAPLLDILRDNWSLFADALLDDESVWAGRTVELRKIRNRIGHCRRPHPDDLSRVEQTLRDLDTGAFRAASAFNRQHHPERDLSDPLVEAWVQGQHEDARRLLNHADQQYDTRFVLRYSRRPWAVRRKADDPISGRPGYLWHANWFVGGRGLDLRGLWKDGYLDECRELIVYVCATDPMSVEVSYAAVDDPARIANAIGNCFDALLTSGGRYGADGAWDDTWAVRHADLDARVQTTSAWSIVDETMDPITMFGA